MKGLHAGGLLTFLRGRSTQPESETKPRREAAKFELRPPSIQNAIDIFAGKWASDLGPVCDVTGTGSSDLFRDPRPQMAADALGHERRLDGFRVLELGPLEAAHTYLLERLGASEIVAVEANTEAFLKCLIVKEALGLTNAQFLCGDIVALPRRLRPAVRPDLLLRRAVSHVRSNGSDQADRGAHRQMLRLDPLLHKRTEQRQSCADRAEGVPLRVRYDLS